MIQRLLLHEIRVFFFGPSGPNIRAVMQWEANQEGNHENRDENVANLKSRCRREFCHARESISNEHREHIKSLIEKYPINNHIFGMLHGLSVKCALFFLSLSL
jgi:glycerol dehydrogenase-like iron-containing ADH family enzyme